MAALSTNGLQSESELLSSLSRRRTALRESLRMNVLAQSGTLGGSEGQPATFAETTAETLLTDLKNRRARRKGVLPPLNNSQLPEPRPQSADGSIDAPPGVRRLRALQNSTHRTRFDEPLRSETGSRTEEDQQWREELEHEQVSESSMRWKRLSARLGEVTKQNVEQQSYDFFTSSIADGLDEEPVREQQDEQMEGDDGHDQDDTLALVQQQNLEENMEEELTAPAPRREGLCQYALPRYIPRSVRESHEKELYFIPTSKVAVVAGEEAEMREAGLFVKENPRFRTSNLHVMENRIQKRTDPEGEEWFSNDGRLKILPNPLRTLVTRPLLIAQSEDQFLHHRDPSHLASMHKYLMAVNNNGISSEGHLLKVTIGSLHFRHHPLFSVEHVISSLLERACHSYHSTDRVRLSQHYREKLQALKYAVLDLTQQLAEHDQEEGEVMDEGRIEMVQRMRNQLVLYKQEVHTVRQNLKQTEAADYTGVQTVLRLWQQLKTIRENQGYSSTPTQLLVHRMAANAEEDAALWERDIADELSELREDHDTANAQAILDHKQALAEWKVYEKRRRRSLRQARADSAQSHTPTNTDVGSQASLETTANTTVPPERPRPQAPPTFDADSAHHQLVQYYRQHRRKPGEPRLVPELNHTHPTSQPCPSEEQQRRDSVVKSKLKLKILYNDKLACQTSDYYLGPDFNIQFAVDFSLSVVELPRSITLQIFDISTFFSSLVAEIFLSIPDSEHTVSRTSLQEYQFSSQEKIDPAQCSVGSGHACSQLPSAGVLVTNGSVTVSVCWGEGPNQESLCPPGLIGGKNKQGTDPITSVGVSGITDVEKVKRWIEESQLDPNDPRNFDLLQLVDAVPSSDDGCHYFRLQLIDECAQLVEEDVVESDRRFALLEMRQQGHPGLKGRSIPLNSSSITESVWKSIHQYKPYTLSELPTTIFGNFYQGQEAERARYLQDVRERVIGRSRTRPHSNLTTQDVIHDEIIPNIGALQKTFVGLFSPRRPLKPQRRLRRVPKPQNVNVSECKLIIHVVRAVGVPGRGGADMSGGPLLSNQTTPQHYGPMHTTSGGLSNFSPSHAAVLTSPFVRVTFGKEKARTRTNCGQHPYWNEELTLPFHPPGDDFSPASLQKMMDMIRFDLMDEDVLDLLQDDRQRGTDIHRRLENRWLGSLSIPFSTLHARTRVEGTFQLNQPPLLLGYHQTDSAQTFLQVFITLEPTLSVLPPLREHFDSAESSQLLERASQWEKTLREKYPHRNYTSTVLDVSGKRVLITRYILPQSPPDELLPPQGDALSPHDLLHCMERLAWYVSLIPSLPDAVLFSGTCDIWTTSDQFLKMLGGDEEEHAVLLCNYFLHINQQAYVLLGHGIPEGPTAYVLSGDPCSPGDHLLWNPSTGHHYSTTHHHNPLISVGCVFNNNTVWGNIQEGDEPSRVTFDLSNKKHWTPLLLDDFQPLLSVQQDVLEYSEIDIVRVQELQTRLDRLLHEHIVEIRKRHITRWNNHCSRLLMDALPEFEAKPYYSNHVLDHQRNLTQHFPAHKLQGFPIHVQCWDTKQLLDEVDLTAIPHCGHERAEFGLGLFLHPYPGHVLSVWLYLVVMTPV